MARLLCNFDSFFSFSSLFFKYLRILIRLNEHILSRVISTTKKYYSIFPMTWLEKMVEMDQNCEFEQLLLKTNGLEVVINSNQWPAECLVDLNNFIGKKVFSRLVIALPTQISIIRTGVFVSSLQNLKSDFWIVQTVWQRSEDSTHAYYTHATGLQWLQCCPRYVRKLSKLDTLTKSNEGDMN